MEENRMIALRLPLRVSGKREERDRQRKVVREFWLARFDRQTPNLPLEIKLIRQARASVSGVRLEMTWVRAAVAELLGVRPDSDQVEWTYGQSKRGTANLCTIEIRERQVQEVRQRSARPEGSEHDTDVGDA